MIKVTKILTNDGEMFDCYEDAQRHLDKEYGQQITTLAIKLLDITKYAQMLEFLDQHLELFNAAIELKHELNQAERLLEVSEDE